MRNYIYAFIAVFLVLFGFWWWLSSLVRSMHVMPRSISFSLQESSKNGLLIKEYQIDKVVGKLDFEVEKIWLEYQGSYDGYSNKLIETDKKVKVFIIKVKILESLSNSLIRFCVEDKISNANYYVGKFDGFIYMPNFESEKLGNIKIYYVDKECKNIKAQLFLRAKKHF